jgi:magnesium chelatase family protein
MVNADAEGAVLQTFATPNADGQALLIEITKRFGLTARGYHRVMRVARTIADLAGSEVVERAHIAEADSFQLPAGRGPSQPRKSRNAAAAAQPEKMAMANESSP